MKNAITTSCLFHGRKEMAAYRDPGISLYRGNPLIEALPAILSPEEAVKRLQHLPCIDENDRRAPPSLRGHALQVLKTLFIPLSDHLELESALSRLIRLGYVSRNPLRSDFWAEHTQRIDCVATSRPWEGARCTATGLTVVGISGVGKTTTLQRILEGLYPQLICHSSYQDRPFSHVQMVWLKLDCPHDGSVRGLCLQFFEAVDECCGTEYRVTHGGARHTVDQMIPSMAAVASVHHLGVLVIDEVQHLSAAKSGGRDKMLNFFVQLVNTIGLPVVLVGTSKATSVLSGEFRQMRRGAGHGNMFWDRLEPGVYWEYFMDRLWNYQYTVTPTPRTKELTDALYDETQGITDFVIKIFMLSQLEAIRLGGAEQMTVELIQSVARRCLRLAAPVLAALRTRDLKELLKYDDVRPLNLDEYIEKALQRQSMESCALPQKPAPGDKMQSIKQTQRRKRKVSEESIARKVQAIRKAGQKAPEFLKSLGLIKNVSEAAA